MIFVSIRSPIYQRFNEAERYQYMNLEKEYAFIETNSCGNIELCMYSNKKIHTLSFYPEPSSIRTILSKRNIQ